VLSINLKINKMGLSNFGILHTVIGVIAIVAAVIGFIKNGKIDLSQLTGKIYFYCTLITSLTALGLSKQGGFNPGHIFALFIVVLIVLAYFLYSKKVGSRKARFFENGLLSFSFFLSLVPTVNETFTRVPVGHPLASAPTDPIIGQTLLVLFVLFVVGSVFQFRKQKEINRLV
jgi:ABC-type multidrug transport system fused ATPase/permease subunit